MSKKSENSKYFTLDDVRVYYDKKKNTISLTSGDEDVIGKPFHVVLNEGTPTERTLRNLVVKHDLIPQDVTEQYTIPKHVPYPSLKEDASTWDEFPLGVIGEGKGVSISVPIAPNTLVCGVSGSGKSVLMRNFILHTFRHQAKWDVYGVDMKEVELGPYVKYPMVRAVATTREDGLSLLKELNNQIISRYADMEAEGVTNYKDLSYKPRAILIVVENLTSLLNSIPSRRQSSFHHDSTPGLTLEELKKIVRLGRSAGIHLLVGSDPVGGTYGLLFNNKVLLGQTSENCSQTILNNSNGADIRRVVGSGVVQSSSLVTFNDHTKLSEDEDQFFQLYYSTSESL